MFTMVRFGFNIKTCCLNVIWEKQDQIWAKIFCIPKNIHVRTPMPPFERSLLYISSRTLQK